MCGSREIPSATFDDASYMAQLDLVKSKPPAFRFRHLEFMQTFLICLFMPSPAIGSNRRLEFCKKVIIIPWFCDKVVRTKLHGPYRNIHISKCSDDDNGRRILQTFQIFKPEQSVTAVKSAIVEIQIKEHGVIARRVRKRSYH